MSNPEKYDDLAGLLGINKGAELRNETRLEEEARRAQEEAEHALNQKIYECEQGKITWNDVLVWHIKNQKYGYKRIKDRILNATKYS